MKINPRYIKMSAAAVAAFLSACTIEVEPTTDENGVPTWTNTVSELYAIECNAERTGSKVFVNGEQMTFECDGREWNGAYPGQDSTKRVIAHDIDRSFVYGSIVDARDHKTYKTIKIGNQNWLAQNLNYNNFDSWCLDEITNCEEDGRYYSWYSAMDIDEGIWQISIEGIEEEHQGACPDGWHVPTIDEWEELFRFVAGTYDYDFYEDSVAYKLRSNFGWKFNMNGWDVYGLALTPSGYYDQVFDYEVKYKTTSIYQWTATPDDGYRTHSRYFEMTDDMILTGSSYDNRNGMSVRCVENTKNLMPTDSNPMDTPVDVDPVDPAPETGSQTTEPTGPTGAVVSCQMEMSIAGVSTNTCDEYAEGSETAEAAVAQCVTVDGFLTATLGNGCPANYTKKCVINNDAVTYFYDEAVANQDCSEIITTK